MPSSAHAQLNPILRWLFGTNHCERPDVAQKARLLLLDTLGCALAGLDAPVVKALAAGHAAHPSGQSAPFRLPGLATVDPGAATELLATGAVWDEACEGLARAHGRPGVGVVAGCWPIAVGASHTLGEMLDAMVTGYEIGARMGEWLRIRPGMHVDAGWPAFGVAAAAARLLRRSPDEGIAALEMVGCQVPFGLYLPVRAGANARNTYLANAAHLGLAAARAVMSGMDAPQGALDDYARLALGLDPQALRLPLAGELLLLESYLKPFAAVRHVHYGVVAALQLRPRFYARLARIQSIELAIYEEAIQYCGNRDPHTAIAAQFSLSFGAAAALRFGELTPAVYRDPRFCESGLRRLEQRIEIRADPARWPAGRRGAELTLRMADESASVIVEKIKGDPDDPLRVDEVRTKFIEYAARSAQRDRAATFADRLIEGSLSSSCAVLWTDLLS